MKTFVRTLHCTLLLASLVALASPLPAIAGGTWGRFAMGVSGLAMDDINNNTYSFYDFTLDGYNLPDINNGFAMSFSLGYDLSPTVGLGFEWERQYAGTKGTDVDVTADLDLDANLFLGRLYWRPIRGRSWKVGATVATGPIFSDGKVDVYRGSSVSYGESELSGSSFSFEGTALVDYRLTPAVMIQLTAGWRLAKIDEFKHNKAPVYNEDGSRTSLDYTGYVVKLGVVYYFGGRDLETDPDLY